MGKEQHLTGAQAASLGLAFTEMVAGSVGGLPVGPVALEGALPPLNPQVLTLRNVNTSQSAYDASQPVDMHQLTETQADDILSQAGPHEITNYPNSIPGSKDGIVYVYTLAADPLHPIIVENPNPDQFSIGIVTKMAPDGQHIQTFVLREQGQEVAVLNPFVTQERVTNYDQTTFDVLPQNQVSLHQTVAWMAYSPTVGTQLDTLGIDRAIKQTGQRPAGTPTEYAVEQALTPITVEYDSILTPDQGIVTGLGPDGTAARDLSKDVYTYKTAFVDINGTRTVIYYHTFQNGADTTDPKYVRNGTVGFVGGNLNPQFVSGFHITIGNETASDNGVLVINTKSPATDATSRAVRSPLGPIPMSFSGTVA